jgi:hypothetical protein
MRCAKIRIAIGWQTIPPMLIDKDEENVGGHTYLRLNGQERLRIGRLTLPVDANDPREKRR